MASRNGIAVPSPVAPPSERQHWSVYAVRPRPNGKEGKNWTLKAEPPPELRRMGAKPIRKASRWDNEAQAREEAQGLARKLNATVFLGSDPTLVDVLEKHLAWRQTRNAPKDTLAAYGAAIRRVRPLLDLPCSEITTALLIRAQDELLAVPLAPGTVNQTFFCVRKAWSWALEREWAKVAFPGLKQLEVPETLKRPFSDSEVEQVLAWVAGYQGGYWLPLFVLLADTGARVGELLKVKGADVDREERTIRLPRTNTKTKRARTLRPPASTMALLAQVAPNEYVFQAKRLGCRRGKVLERRVPLGILWRAIEALKLPDGDNLDLHSFRRSWITSAHDGGVPLNVSMSATGHSSTRVHLDYARRANRDAAGAVDAVRERRRNAAGERPWEQTANPSDPLLTASDTAQHRTEQRPNSGHKSSHQKGEFPSPASCWNASSDSQVAGSQGHDRVSTARPTGEAGSGHGRRAALLLGGDAGRHPFAQRVQQLVTQDPEALWVVLTDSVVGPAVQQWLASQQTKPKGAHLVLEAGRVGRVAKVARVRGKP